MEITGDSEDRQGEHLSPVRESVKAALTGGPQSRDRLYRASISDSGGRKVAGARTTQAPPLNHSWS